MRILCERVVNGKYTGEYDFIDLLKDVFFIDIIEPKKNHKVTCYHTNKGKFGPILTLEGHRAALEQFGYAKLDSVNVVNLMNIHSLDEATGRVCFEDGSSTSIAGIHRDSIKKMLKKRTS
jgi:hypothetical protein